MTKEEILDLHIYKLSNKVDAKAALECIEIYKDQQLTRIIDVYSRYVTLLSDELDDTVPIAASNGWKSNRFEEGKRLREEISLLRAGLNEMP